MKKRLFLLLMIALLLAAAAKGLAIEKTPDYIRLHIMANSDGDWDQAVKLQVRDDIRELAAERLGACASAEEAYEELIAQQEDFLAAATRRARACGFEGEVSIEVGTFDFPDRVYGDELVPAGKYRALRILLGEAQGKNWWCVIYPGLCLPEERESEEPVVFYSSIGRWFMRLFGGNDL